ncbi:hypothetical protein KJ567_00515 [Candidatus Bipolaricaulota bacterium]|nr:hypothetical protein [Candidatus Bipolaricaulota bacterium]
MTERLERTTFEGHEGTLFTAVKTGRTGVTDHDIGPVDLTLAKVEDRSNDAIDAFSCLFHGPKAQELGQATYRLTHDVLGEIDLFLVPVLDPGSDGTTVCYQFIVSRLKE